MAILLTSAWWLAKLAWFRDGASRWFNKETLLAIVVGIGIFATLAAGVGIWRGLQAGQLASVIAKMHQGTIEALKARMDQNARLAEEAARQRDVAQRERDEEVERRLALEREIATMKDDPVVFTQDERRRLFK